MKRSKLVKKLTVVALTMVAIASLAVGCTSSKEGSTNTANSNSKLFKEMKTEDINGNKVDSSIFSKYKLTVVNVWNTGCTPCVGEIPTLDKLNKEYEKRWSIMDFQLDIKESKINLSTTDCIRRYVTR